MAGTAVKPYQPPNSSGSRDMSKKTWQAPKVETTPVSMEVTMYLPAQA